MAQGRLAHASALAASRRDLDKEFHYRLGSTFPGASMRERYIQVLVCIAAGLLYIAVPHVLLPVCDYAGPAAGEQAPPMGYMSGAMPLPGHSGPAHMVCYWTARAEAGLGGVFLFSALLLLLSASRERRSGIMLTLAGSAVLGGAIPSLLIGVCRQETMPCRAGTLPALLLLSGFFFLFALLGGLYSGRRRKESGNG
jgi:hypothetical protein